MSLLEKISNRLSLLSMDMLYFNNTLRNSFRWSTEYLNSDRYEMENHTPSTEPVWSAFWLA